MNIAKGWMPFDRGTQIAYLDPAKLDRGLLCVVVVVVSMCLC